MTVRAEKGHLAKGGMIYAPGKSERMKEVARKRKAEAILDQIGTLAAPLNWKYVGDTSPTPRKRKGATK